LNLFREKLLILGLLGGIVAIFLAGLYLAHNPQINLRTFGFPRCAWLVLFGKPCPLCGGYTAFTAALRGDLAAAWEANPFALFFLGGIMVLGVALLVALLKPTSVKPWLRSRTLRMAGVFWPLSLLFILVFFWICRLI
jgi:hypothetical protein